MSSIVNKDSIFSEQMEYYKNLRNQCLLYHSNQLHVGQKMIYRIYPFIRNYSIEIEGEENIPKNQNVLFVANHSNSHDIFTAYEMFSSLGVDGSVMVATDCLNPFTTQLFNISNATLLDRRISDERYNSVIELSKKLIEGKSGLIFGEGTWNIHPTKLMHNIHNGASKISLITRVPIVPVIFEYIEKDDLVSSDSELLQKCIIRFGNPIYFDYCQLLSNCSNIIKNAMIELRKQIRNDYNVSFINDPDLYINHTYAKKFGAFGFEYDSANEQQFLLFLDGEQIENEYTLNEQGNFLPGITEKDTKKNKLSK